ncbi:MAG: plasmid pRiA4b ORF-3 family protein [Acidimicrobiales bacterium]
MPARPSGPSKPRRSDAVPPELATAIAEVPVLKRFVALASFYAKGRKLTQTGNPTLADARQLVEALGLDDRFDQDIAGHVFRTRSAGELPELSFTLRWAIKAGVLRKEHGRLRETTTWSQASPVEQFQRAGQALVALGPLAGYFGGDWLRMASTVDSAFPSLLLRLADGPLGYAEALDYLTYYMYHHYRWPDPWTEEDALRAMLDQDLSLTVRLLEVAGAVEPGAPSQKTEPGDEAGTALTPTGTRLRLLQGGSDEPAGPGERAIRPTPVGLWLLPRLKISSAAPQVYDPLLSPESGSVHELRVVLDEVEPEVWRGLAVSSALSLAGLHRVVQAAMGWEDYHLHEFTLGAERYGADDGEDWDGPPKDERLYRLAELAVPGQTFSYIYDFGDGWEHTVHVLAVRPRLPGEDLPRCTGGERACPPEDVGGTGGYERFLAAISDPTDGEHDHLLEWAGGSFDPGHFDVAEANRRLRDLRWVPGSLSDPY